MPKRDYFFTFQSVRSQILDAVEKKKCSIVKLSSKYMDAKSLKKICSILRQKLLCGSGFCEEFIYIQINKSLTPLQINIHYSRTMNSFFYFAPSVLSELDNLEIIDSRQFKHDPKGYNDLPANLQ
jgi:hypothetical protein